MLEQTRLLTITGIGGAGKTRVALELARRTAARFPDGIWIARLSHLTDPDLVPLVVADELDVSTGGGAFGVGSRRTTSSLGHLQAFLGGKHALVILDHCEQVVGGAAGLTTALLARCASLTIVATSQLALQSPGERIWRIPPLEVPDAHDDVAQTATRDAVRLFLMRAHEADPGFRADERVTTIVGRICRRLDGSPLAIELAAARTDTLDVAEIADRLDDRFALLRSTGAAESDRHRTLEAAVAWSYDLLDADERLALARLSVFPGTFSADAAERIITSEDLPPERIVDVLGGLIGKSVLLREGPDRRRYRVPATLRGYAAARLDDHEGREPFERAHTSYYLDFVKARASAIYGPDEAAAFHEIEQEHHNIHSVVERAVSSGDAWTALTLINVLSWMWFIRGYEEAVGLIRRALAMTEPADPAVRSHAEISASLVLIGRGHHDEALALLDRALAEREAAGDVPAAAQAELFRGLIAFNRGDPDRATRRYRWARDCFEDQHVEFGIAWADWFLGWTAREAGLWEQAAEFIEAALDRFRRLRHSFGIANALAEKGRIARRRGAVREARRAHEEALAIFRALGDRVRIAECLGSLAIDERRLGEYDLGLRRLEEGIAVASDIGAAAAEAEGEYLRAEILQAMGDDTAAEQALQRSIALASDCEELPARYTFVVALESLAALDTRQRRHGRAVRLASAAAARRVAIDRPATPEHRARVDALGVEARSHLSEDEYRRLSEGGRAMDDAQVVAAALADGDPVTGSETAISLEQVELGERVARHLEAVGDRMEFRVGGIRMAGRRRRPTGESPPLPIDFRASGWFWLGMSLMGILIWASLFLWPESTQWWERQDQTLLDWVVRQRTNAATNAARAFHALGSPWFWRPLRWLTLIVLVVVAKRWRHFFAVLIALLAVGGVTEWVANQVARQRPFVPIIGAWQGYSHPSVPVADLAVTLAVIGLALIPPGRWRTRFMAGSGILVLLLVSARVYLGVDHPSDGLVSAIVGPAFAVVVFRLWAPESVFPVAYRRGRTAHLDVGGARGSAITTAVADQLGIPITDIRPIGLESSGGSTPLRLSVAGDPPTHLFAKLYARSHLRADRWYKLGRTILYGALEDEVSFRTVRRLVEYEDYMLLTMWKARIPSARPYGVVEITPDREYLIVTEFLHDASEIGNAQIDAPLVDDALLIIRRLWDEGLAHRDIKPANVMVADGRVRLIDVAFGTVRPTPWRQAVDLANMMLILSLHVPPAVVYGRALQFFAPEDIAEAFAASRGITMPRQLAAELKARQRSDGIDRVAAFRALAPAAEPISIQRWSPRRIGLALGALVAILILIQLIVENVQGRGIL